MILEKFKDKIEPDDRKHSRNNIYSYTMPEFEFNGEVIHPPRIISIQDNSKRKTTKYAVLFYSEKNHRLYLRRRDHNVEHIRLFTEVRSLEDMSLIEWSLEECEFNPELNELLDRMGY